MKEFEVKTDEVDMEVAAELCDFLHDVFRREIEDGVTPSELVLSVGTVLSSMFNGDGRPMH